MGDPLSEPLTPEQKARFRRVVESMSDGWGSVDLSRGEFLALLDENEALQRRVRQATYYDQTHMRGWETFAAIPVDSGNRPPREVTSRPLGTNAMRKDPPAGQRGYDLDGVHNGVAHIELAAFGDLPTGAYVRVTGPDREAVERCFKAIKQAVLDGLTGSWFAAALGSEGSDTP